MAQDNSAEIAELEAILNAGARSVTTDGTTVTYDLEQIRARLRELRAQDVSQKGRRPVVSSFDLSRF